MCTVLKAWCRAGQSSWIIVSCEQCGKLSWLFPAERCTSPARAHKPNSCLSVLSLSLIHQSNRRLDVFTKGAICVDGVFGLWTGCPGRGRAEDQLWPEVVKPAMLTEPRHCGSPGVCTPSPDCTTGEDRSRSLSWDGVHKRMKSASSIVPQCTVTPPRLTTPTRSSHHTFIVCHLPPPRWVLTLMNQSLADSTPTRT